MEWRFTATAFLGISYGRAAGGSRLDWTGLHWCMHALTKVRGTAPDRVEERKGKGREGQGYSGCSGSNGMVWCHVCVFATLILILILRVRVRCCVCRTWSGRGVGSGIWDLAVMDIRDRVVEALGVDCLGRSLVESVRDDFGREIW